LQNLAQFDRKGPCESIYTTPCGKWHDQTDVAIRQFLGVGCNKR
jgi:hypothetical protein